MSDLDEETMDLNIDNYTTDELLLIYNLDSSASKNEIYAQSSRFLERFKGDDKKEFYDFFEKARSKLITSLTGSFVTGSFSHIVGNSPLTFGGDTQFKFVGHLTASGNVSASGFISISRSLRSRP